MADKKPRLGAKFSKRTEQIDLADDSGVLANLRRISLCTQAGTAIRMCVGSKR